MDSADETFPQELHLGLSELDDQHQAFFLYVVGLRQALTNGRGGRDKLMETLRFLDRFVEEHFASEERLMRLHNYPGVLMHRLEHEKFAKAVAAFKEKALALDRRGDVISFLAVEIEHDLERWLFDHILRFDRKMADFLHDRT